MSIQPGTHELGPHNAQLLVRTSRTGAAAKAGHDLTIEVTSWSGTLEVDDGGSPQSATLSADGGSLRVREGTGGIQSLGDDERDSIRQSIDDEVLKRTPIEFRSTSVQGKGDAVEVRGDLKLLGTSRPIAFELQVDSDKRLAARAVVTQSEWGIKPFSILFGTLKVADEVAVTLDARLDG